MSEARTRLIEGLDNAREAMLKVLAEVERNWEVYPGWTIKQILAHLTGWDEAVTASLRAYVEGTESSIASYRGINEYNARSVETRQALNYEQTRREWEIAREDLKAALHAVTDAKFGGQIMTPWGERTTIPQMVEIFIEHEHTHAEEILSLKGQL